MCRRTFRPALAFHALTPLYDQATDLLGSGAPFIRRVADALALDEIESLLDVGSGPVRYWPNWGAGTQG